MKVLKKLSRLEFSLVGLALHFLDKETVIEDLGSYSNVVNTWLCVCTHYSSKSAEEWVT